MLSRRRNIDLPHGTTPASSEMEGKPQAPVYNIERREVIAVEHPMIIKNLDDALKTFGTNRPFRRVSLRRPLSVSRPGPWMPLVQVS
jgi:hypothetical protein